MRYYATYDDDDNIVAIGTGEYDGVEITETQYNEILTRLQLENEYVLKVYLQEITLDEVPEEYRNEVEKRVEILIREKENEPEDTSDVNYDELVDVIREGVNEV